MDEKRYQRAKELFLEVCDLDPEKQMDILEKECAGDKELRLEVESLLVHHVGASDLIETAAVTTATPTAKDTAERERIGPYRVIHKIGEGGMGVVYLAVRDDDKFKRHVAIKLLKRGMDTAAVLRRFELERQLHAAMNHPGIARIYDGGETDDGLPYLVMEYIEGQPIDDYCDVHRLRIAERLELFSQVCSAVHYAHQNLVVHRDLKPSNILVTKDGVPKLLDFGIAKLLNPELALIISDPTAPELRVMTPEYASPEQVRGNPITTATDVYSLGVLLYELMSGHRPYHLRSRIRAEIERVICEEEPEKPSTSISRIEEDQSQPPDTTKSITPESVAKVREGRPDRLRRRLRGDVDNIVLLAMRKEPQRRYASAKQMAEDIQRHLDGLPVIARANTFGYRFWKFVRRHRAGVAAGVIMALLLVGGIITTSVLRKIAIDALDEATAQRTIAEAARVQAETARDRAARLFDEGRKLSRVFMGEFHDAVVKLSGSIPARELLVDEALQYLQGLEKEAGDDTSLKLDIAWGHRRVALILGGTRGANLNRTEEAIKHINTALQVHEDIAQSEPDNTENLHGLATCHLYLADMLNDQQKTAQAADHYRQALNIAEQRLELIPTDDRALRDVAIMTLEIGDVFRSDADYAGAAELYQRSLAIREELAEREPEGKTARRDLTIIYTRLGALNSDQGQFDQALKYYEQVLDQRHAIAEDEPDSARAARDVMNAHTYIASVLSHMKDAEGALLQMEQAIVIARQLREADPEDRRARRDLPRVRSYYGNALADAGKPAEARRQLETAIAEYELLAADFPDDHRWPQEVATLRQALTEIDDPENDTPPD